NLERDEPIGEAGGPPLEQRLAPEELALVESDEALESGFERRIFDRQLSPDQPVRLLEPQRIHGPDSERLNPHGPAGIHKRVENVVLHLDRVVQLITEFADEIDA